jgi:hypothetical protein
MIHRVASPESVRWKKVGRFKPQLTPQQKANRRQDEQDLQDGFCLRPTDAIDSYQLNPCNLLHPVHPVHPVEKSGFDLIIRIVANRIDSDRYQHTNGLGSVPRRNSADPPQTLTAPRAGG